MPKSWEKSALIISTVLLFQNCGVSFNNNVVISYLGNRTYPLTPSSPLIQGQTYKIGSSNTPIGQWTCTFQTLGLPASDPNYAPEGTNCSQLDSLVTSSSGVQTVGKLTVGTGDLVWTPTYTHRGTYQFKLAHYWGSESRVFPLMNLTVRENSSANYIVSGLDALNASAGSGLNVASAPFTSSDRASTWLNISSGQAGVCNFGSSAPWAGTGRASTTSVDPYRLNFLGSNSDSLNLGSPLSSATKMAASAWVKPSSPTAAGTVIASNGGGDGNGFALRQSSTPTGRAEFVVGKKYYSYKDLILSDKPMGYWRLGETSGTTAADLSAYGNNATYTGGYTLNQTGPIYGDSDGAVLFNGTSGYATLSNSSAEDISTGDFSLEGWFKTSSASTTSFPTIVSKNSGTNGYTLFTQINSGTLGVSLFISGANWGVNSGKVVTDGQWHHFAVTRSGISLNIYVDGVYTNQIVNATIASTLTNATNFKIGYDYAGTNFNGSIDEVAVYGYALNGTQITEHYQTGIAGGYKTYPGNAILADKPVGYWRLGEKSGQIAYDSSGNGNNGSISQNVKQDHTGALSLDSDRSMSFDGNTATVTVPYTSTLNPNTFTIETWAKVTGGSGNFRAPVFSRGAVFTGYNFYADSTDTWNFWIGNGAGWVNGLTNRPSIKLDQWTHLVGVYTGSTISLYVNGAFISSSAASFSPNASGTLDIGGSGSSNFYGFVDEVAVYSYPLSSTQIVAHYNSGLGAGWWTCQSQTQLNSSNWNLLQGLYDGTTAKLFVNGQQECSVTPGTTYSGAVADVKVGATPSGTSFWSGALAMLKLFGSSDTTPASATTAYTDFSSEANRFRQLPQENTVTSGLQLHFDAANAKQGLAPFTNGCASSDLSWFDLSSNSYNGTLWNFSSCGATSGWVGAGTVASPYALAFDGSDDYVAAPWSTLTAASARTIGVWFKTSSTANASILSWGANATNQLSDIGIQSSAIGFFGGSTSLSTPATSYANNQWHYLAFTYDGSTRNLYIDGAQKASDQNVTLNTGTSSLYLGKSISGANLYTGSVSIAHVYNRGLSSSEIKQNCLAQEKRFTSTTGGICGQP